MIYRYIIILIDGIPDRSVFFLRKDIIALRGNLAVFFSVILTIFSFTHFTRDTVGNSSNNGLYSGMGI